MGVVTKQDTSSTGMKYPSVNPRRNGECSFSQDIPSDVVILVGNVAYSLHKFPLVSRSGLLRRKAAESKNADVSKIELTEFPGGADAFEYAAKFCYGLNFEIDTKNVAALRCAAEYLEMTEEYAEENLIARTEAYLNEVVLSNLSSCVAVLQACESLLSMTAHVNIVGRCVEAAAANACREQMTATLSRSDFSSSGRMDGSPGFANTPRRHSIEWWAEELSVLRIDIYQMVVCAMKARGVGSDSVGAAIKFYAQRWLRGLIRKQSGVEPGIRKKTKASDAAAALENEQRVLVETLVHLLPHERNITSVGFLFALLRAAIYLDTTVACKHDLERRIGWQLEQASLDDLLIPSYGNNGDTLFEVDTVIRIVMNFLQRDGKDEDHDVLAIYDYESTGSPPQSSIMKAARLLDCYLAEVAPDANLSVVKFVALGELMPEYGRVVDDGLYRAIDIYLKAHPGANELDRKKVCSLMDCQKLSQQACLHAAQNERLPVQIVVQVLYYEQMRLRNVMTSGEGEKPEVQQHSHRNDYDAVHRENAQLKMEVARMRSQLSSETDSNSMQLTLSPKASDAGDSEPHVKGGEKPKSRFFQSVSKKLGKLNPFQRVSAADIANKPPRTPDVRSRRRRHSMS